jgi:hypothetical protein
MPCQATVFGVVVANVDVVAVWILHTSIRKFRIKNYIYCLCTFFFLPFYFLSFPLSSFFFLFSISIIYFFFLFPFTSLSFHHSFFLTLFLFSFSISFTSFFLSFLLSFCIFLHSVCAIVHLML